MRLGELLTTNGLITGEQLEYALREVKRSGVRLGQILVDHGFIDEGSLYDALARLSGRERLDLRTVDIDPAAARVVDGAWCTERAVIPVWVDSKTRQLFVATTDPTNVGALDELQFKTGMRVMPIVASDSEVARLVRHFFYRETLDRSMHSARLGHPTTGRIDVDPEAIVMGIDALLSDVHSPIEDPAPPPPSPPKPTAPSVLDEEKRALSRLKPIYDGQQETARLLRAIFELCMRRGIITREEYVARLERMPE